MLRSHTQELCGAIRHCMRESEASGSLRPPAEVGSVNRQERDQEGADEYCDSE